MATRVPKQHIYLTAISIQAGIITVILDDGSLGYFRQRGIDKIPEYKKNQLIALGMLNPHWNTVKTLPSNISIEFEDEEIMGKARATYPDADKLLSAAYN